ncbi:Alpha/Beta hydrolase protein [Lyophyllum atratum]|nr:Alpha/Beta hydrolase protein [Lyophyllum atratum]
MSPQAAPYGTWSSPITAEAITKGAISFPEVIVDPITSNIYHIESRPSEDGRNVLLDTKTGKELTPGKDWNVRTAVHEYGGAAAIVHNKIAYFSRFTDGRVYRLKEGGEPEAVTPESKVHRFANFEVHPVHTHLLVSVLEDHTIDEPAAIVNTLCIINTKTNTVHPLVSGADFYASSKFSPDGTRLAWEQWFHPDMPWEGGQIHVGDVVIESDTLSVKNTIHVAGEARKVSAAFPSWASNDTLIFTSDESGYINPWKYQDGKATALFPAPVEQEFGSPMWTFTIFPYAILDKQGRYALFITLKNGRNGLHIVDLIGGSAPQSLDTPYVVIHNIRSVNRENQEVVFTGAKVDEEASIIKCTIADLSGPPTFEVLKSANAPPFSSDFVSIPQPMTFKASNGDPIHVVYYAPKNPGYSGSSIAGERPPCALYVHGGPTGITLQSLNWKVQYFTSRGWAWLDVNYGGSAGYGREYIHRLVGNWGVVDVDDCIQAARIISSSPYDLVDPKRIVIRGGSAGGYTVLAALANAPDVTTFAAGTSSYGISGLQPLGEHTHKFESRYLEKLIGGTLEEVPDVYKERSPLNNADKIVSPLLILQGEIDKVVPKEQAEVIYNSVKSRGGIVEYKMYPGEGHGWRQEKNIRDALERELGFYENVLKLKN